MRIFVGSTEIAGIGEGLRQGFVALGHECDVVTEQPHPFAYSTVIPRPWFAVIWLQLYGKVQGAGPKSSVKGFFWRLIRYLWSWAVLLASLFRYDAFIFLYGSTITNTELELWLLKRLKKRIIVTYVGSDARPPYMDGGKFQPPIGAIEVERAYYETRRTAARVALHERYASEIISYHGICHFNRRRLVNWFVMGIPTAIDASRLKVPEEAYTKTVVALHSPSNPALKGTAVIENAVAQLKSRGIDFELKLLKNVPNSTVLAELAKCDFVIDQLYSDTPLAGFATEAARFGKPAVVGGYLAAESSQYIPQDAMPPSEFVHPDQIVTAIEKLVTDGNYREQLGQRAKIFVNERWSSRSVAERYLRLIKDDVPNDWYFDPSTTRYCGGCGLPEEAVIGLVNAVASNFGAVALHVDDKPMLKRALLSLRKPVTP